MKIDPPFPDFMQSGINTGINDLSSEIKSENDFNEVSNQQTTEPQTTEPPPFIPQQKTKYKIQSLFWLINRKPYHNQELEQNEAVVVTINFNVDFGNLRIEFYDASKQHAIQKNVMFLSELDKLIDGVIYPADCFNIVNSREIDLYPVEQLINYTNEDWQKTRPILYISKNAENLRLVISSHDSSKSYFYDFIDYQREIFQYCCKYCVTTGMQIHGMNKIHS